MLIRELADEFGGTSCLSQLSNKISSPAFGCRLTKRAFIGGALGITAGAFINNPQRGSSNLMALDFAGVAT